MNNMFHGTGKYEYANGDKYNGQWRYHKRLGKGVLESSNGERYDGEWDDTKTGLGKV
jgi:hypothetical protein